MIQRADRVGPQRTESVVASLWGTEVSRKEEVYEGNQDQSAHYNSIFGRVFA